MEIWKDIKGYEGKYQISSYGRIRSLKRTAIRSYRGNYLVKNKILKQSTDKRGVKRVGLYNNGRHTFQVHRLVAQTFIPNPNDLPDINHIDENPSNNNVENLEWCTREYNNNYGTRNERHSKKIQGSKHPQSKKVKCITTGEIFNCMQEAARKYNVSQAHITHCCQGRRNYTGKHPTTKEPLKWEYIE